MKVAVLRQPNSPLVITEADVPEVGPEEVLVRVAACGLCRSDLKIVTGEAPTDYPCIVGHEVSGVVSEIGEKCEPGFATGDRVIVPFPFSCRSCLYCRTGRPFLCTARPRPRASPIEDAAGGKIRRWSIGGFAEYVAVPAYTLFKLPQDVPLNEASVFSCRATTAHNAVVSAGVKAGDSVLVVGCGGLGLAIIEFLRLFGADPIIAADTVASRLDAAREFGATETVDASGTDLPKRVQQLVEFGVDKSFEAAGSPKAIDASMQSVKPDGTVALVGAVRGPFTLSYGFTRSEIRFVSVSGVHPEDVRRALDFASKGKIEPKRLISNTYGLDEINDGFRDLRNSTIRIMGMVVI